MNLTFIRIAALLLASCVGAPKAAEPKQDAAEVKPSLVAKSEAISPSTPAVEPSDLTYGVYLNRAKVGWMQSTITVGSEIVFGMTLEARVGGMGQVSTITVRDERAYNPKTRQLQRLLFSQAAATGTVKITGKRVGDDMVLDVETAGQTRQQKVGTKETLDDALATLRLAKEAKVGARLSVQHFDASLQKNVQINHVVKAIEPRLIAGVNQNTVQIVSVYPELSVEETAWLDSQGTVLESQVGGFFVARLEPPDVAKKLDYQQDLLVSAVVKSPVKLDQAESLAAVTLRFSGFTKPPPTSARQRVEVGKDTVTLHLSRDPNFASASVADVVRAGQSQSEFLAATPFIQSDSPELKEAAQKVIAGSTSMAEANEKLIAFVYSHIRDEYVPAYSNAVEAYRSGRGDCTEHSVLYVAMARALGIPARVAVGIAYWPPGNGFGWHAWAEILVGGRWVTVDPTWNQPIADATHVKLADGGPAEQASIVMLLGQLKLLDVKI